MPQISEYLEKSLKGKWISLARQWLEKNGPCSVEHYMVSVRPLMPTHICYEGSDKRRTQQQLAWFAIRRIADRSQDGLLHIKPRKLSGQKKGSTDEIRRIVEQHGVINARELRHIKNGSSLLSQLCRKGEIRRLGKGVYGSIKTG